MLRYDVFTDEQLRKAIAKQKRMIRSAGYEPTWDLFSRTFGWFQIEKQLSDDRKARYQELWEGKKKEAQ